jgi:hypothetical protein
MPKPDYRRIATLEVETWGEVFTKEAKGLEVPTSFGYWPSRGSWLHESDETKEARARDMDRMIAEAGGI